MFSLFSASLHLKQTDLQSEFTELKKTRNILTVHYVLRPLVSCGLSAAAEPLGGHIQIFSGAFGQGHRRAARWVFDGSDGGKQSTQRKATCRRGENMQAQHRNVLLAGGIGHR